MVYWIRNLESGRCISGANSYEEALKIQHREWKNNKVDTFIE